MLSARQKYAGQTFEKAVATRDGEHTRQLEKGTHHTWRMQRFFNKAGHRVSAALAFDELEATPGETREAFLRRMIAHEQELIDAFRW